MMKMKPISGTVVRGVEAPSLHEMKSRACSPEELQAALVQLIECFNATEESTRNAINALDKALDNKQNKEWRATL